MHHHNAAPILDSELQKPRVGAYIESREDGVGGFLRVGDLHKLVVVDTEKPHGAFSKALGPCCRVKAGSGESEWERR